MASSVHADTLKSFLGHPPLSCKDCHVCAFWLCDQGDGHGTRFSYVLRVPVSWEACGQLLDHKNVIILMVITGIPYREVIPRSYGDTSHPKLPFEQLPL